MSDIFDLTRKKDKNFDEYTFLQNLSADERKRYFEINESVGLAAPTEDGVLTEAGQAFAKGFVNSIKWLNEDYFDSVLRTNQQWNTPPDCSNVTKTSRAIGYSLGFTWYIWLPILVVILFKCKKQIKNFFVRSKNIIKHPFSVIFNTAKKMGYTKVMLTVLAAILVFFIAYWLFFKTSYTIMKNNGEVYRINQKTGETVKLKKDKNAWENIN